MRHPDDEEERHGFNFRERTTHSGFRHRFVYSSAESVHFIPRASVLAAFKRSAVTLRQIGRGFIGGLQEIEKNIVR